MWCDTTKFIFFLNINKTNKMEVNQNVIVTGLLLIFMVLLVLVVYIAFIYDKTSVLTKVNVTQHESQKTSVGIGSSS